MRLFSAQLQPGQQSCARHKVTDLKLGSTLPNMTSPNLLDQSSSLDESDSPEVHTLSPPSSPAFQPRPAPAGGTCTPPEKAILKALPAGSRSVAERERTRLGFPDYVYSHAAHIFQTAHVEKPLARRVIQYAPTAYTHTEDGARTVYGDHLNVKQSELWAFELAFNGLKFQELLEDVLIDSCFCPAHQMPDDLMSLVVVMLYDFQDRKFQPRESVARDGVVPVEEVRRVESSLFSVEEVCETLRAASFVQVEPRNHLEGDAFCTDMHCPDVLLFSQQAQQKLDETLLLTDHSLIIQAKVRSLAAATVHPLLAKDGDILMVGSFSAQTVAHVAVHASACHVRVHICGADPDDREGLQSSLAKIGCKNVQVLSDEFAELNEWDSRIQKIRVILLLPQCTASGLSKPIEHILCEDGDRELLYGLSKGIISDTKLDSLVAKQMQDLSHALTFPKVHTVVYCTCSVYAEENELLVKKALENAVVRPKLRPFRIVSTGWRDETEENFFRPEESDSADGCFICVLKRDQEAAEPETVQDILARAAAKGLLGGLIALEPPDQVKRKKGDKRKGAAASLPPLFPAPPAVADTTGLLTDLGVPDRVPEQYPKATAPRMRAGSMSVSSLTGDDSSCSSIVLNEASTTANHTDVTLDQASTSLSQASAESDSDNSATNEAVNKQRKGQRHRSKGPKTKRSQRKKPKSKSGTRATNAHRSRPSRKRRTTHRPTRVRAHTLAPATTIHPLIPAPPPGTRPNGLQKLYSRRRPQQETSQEVFAPQKAAMDLKGVIKLKQEVENYGKDVVRSIRVVLPPISSSSRTLLTSDLSSHVLQASSTSSSTGSYLSSGLSQPTSRSESRDSERSGVRLWH
ncbi:hypothetical protein NFI96_012687 [Prochilodus magdalenae]|nr:hypothetical protein NFI96_012687 [Prochilodus magdalenae]